MNINVEDIAVYLHAMPTTIKSFVVTSPDMTYNIYLNSRLSREQNLKSYQHELNHILNGDYDKHDSVDLIEINAHQL